jgi:hypothetical protein
MIIHNPILTGSFTVNGIDVSSITSSAASLTSLNAYTASQNNRNGTYATTGSNTFAGIQTVNSNLVVTGSITAQTLVVQTVTSSVVYSSGSNVFGNNITDTQVFTGSMNLTGSLTVVTNGTEFQVTSTGVNFGNALTDSHVISGSVRINPNGLFVSSSGTVGIGTTTQGTRLEVSSRAADADRTIPHNVLTITAEGNLPYGFFGGAILFKNRSYTTGLVESSRIRSVIYDDGAPNNFGGGLWFETTPTPGGTLAPSLVINYQGRVGIGTSTPTAVLDVNGEIRMTGSTLFRGMSSSTLQLCGGLSSSNVKINGSTEIITMDTNGGERLRITANGYTKMSSTSAYAEIGGLYHECYGGAANGYTLIVTSPVVTPLAQYVFDIRFSAATPNNTTARFLHCSDATATRAIIRSNGGLSNFQANNTDLSDIRTKKDIISLESYWNKFKALEIVKYKYIDQTHDDFNIGVIAQQVEEVAPEFVDVDGWSKNDIESESPLKSIYTKDLYHATIKVLQEAMARIETLEIEIDTLKNN